MGHPDPIIYEATVRSLPGGDTVLVSTAPLRPEYGGDGRTLENMEDEAARESQRHARVAVSHGEAQGAR